jgi:hypothetical protein
MIGAFQFVADGADLVRFSDEALSTGPGREIPSTSSSVLSSHAEYAALGCLEEVVEAPMPFPVSSIDPIEKILPGHHDGK